MVILNVNVVVTMLDSIEENLKDSVALHASEKQLDSMMKNKRKRKTHSWKNMVMLLLQKIIM